MLRLTLLALILSPTPTAWGQDFNQKDAPYWKSFRDAKLPIQWNWLSKEKIDSLKKPEVVSTSTFKGFAKFNEATERYARNVKLGSNGELLHYEAGLPFPGKLDPKDPQIALKVMWNYDKRYLGDDFTQTFKLCYVGTDGSIGRWVQGRRKRIWYVGRVALSPIPAFPWAKDEYKRVADMGELTAPSDQQGTVRMGIRYSYDDRQPPQTGAVDDQWVYLPAIRRVRRLTGAQREDPLFGSTIITDEVVGGNDRETLVQTFRYLGETALWTRPLHKPQTRRTHPEHRLIDLPREVELRKVWIVEATHKNPKYIFSKMVYYVDQEVFVMLMTESYDRKGQLWKRHFPMWTVTSDGIPSNYLSYDVDVQSGLGTLFLLSTKPNQGVTPNEVSPDRLYRR